jgi:hypothetical protein
MKYVRIIRDLFMPLMGNVTCGQFFEYDGDLCLRISKNSSGQWEAYNFATKDKIWIPHTSRVTLVDINLHYTFIKDPKD